MEEEDSFSREGIPLLAIHDPWLMLDTAASWILFTGGGSRHTETTVPCSLGIFAVAAAPL